MKITLIRPNLSDVRSSDAMQPLVFAVLRALTPPDVEVDLLDEHVEEIPTDHATDLVALSVETYTARRAYQIAAAFRRRGIPVVMGGCHPTFLPEEAGQFADAVVIGDAEGLWEQVVADARQGRLQRTYRQRDLPPLQGLRQDRSVFRGKRYTPILPVQYGRGCRFACDFCSIHALYGSRLRQRPVDEVADEIKAMRAAYVFFVDDNLLVSEPQAEELFRALVPLKVRWAGQVSVDVAHNARLLDLMAKSGCITVVVGFESLHAENLKQMGKAWSLRYGAYDSAIRAFQERGIMVYGTFIFGYDQDTADTFDEVVDFALRANLCLANFNPLTPTPGTRLYERLRAEGRLIYDPWWLDPAYRYGQAIFHPRGMTAQELTEGCFRARRAFNRYAAILRRTLGPANHRSLRQLGIFLAANLVSRREILRKQNLPLGLDAGSAPGPYTPGEP